jgi:hypothetical protein
MMQLSFWTFYFTALGEYFPSFAVSDQHNWTAKDAKVSKGRPEKAKALKTYAY